MTAGLHHHWRSRAVELAGVGPGDRVLDVATGTGDLALELARRVRPGGEVVGCDFSEAMLERAREPSSAAGAELRFEWADALALALRGRLLRRGHGRLRGRATSPTSSAVSAEMARVVRPGGRVVILEITTPDAAAAVALLPALVRPRRTARWGALAGDSGRLHLPAQLGQALPRVRRAGWRASGARGSARDPLPADRGRHHRDPRRDGCPRR